jgi:hypothetical protein
LSLLKGCLAGILGVVVSQPVDVFLDRSLNSGQGRDSKKLNLFEAAYDVITKDGLQALYVGSSSRFVWGICVISAEFFLYDGFKEFMVNLDVSSFSLLTLLGFN